MIVNDTLTDVNMVLTRGRGFAHRDPSHDLARRLPMWAQTGKVDGLTALEVTIACGRLAGTAPHLRALATVVEPEQLWRLGL